MMAAGSSSAPAPRSVVLVKVDTLGDLVLFAPTLRALRAAWPDTRLHVVIRRAYADLAPLLCDGINWITTTLDPFARGPHESADETARLRTLVAAAAPDVIVAATSRRNWLEAALAHFHLLSETAISVPPREAKTEFHLLSETRRIALGRAEADPFFSVQLKLQLGIDAAAAFPEAIDFPADEPDWQRNFRIADALLGTPVARTRPALAPDAATHDRARAWLREHGLTAGQFAVCAAAGFANVLIKTWPAENFAAALRHLHERHQLPALLIGHESERAHLEAVHSALRTPHSALFLGRDGDLPLLTALIAEAALFLGNDTGALHLAAAVDVPVVGVYGGGTWPRFVPAARRSIAVVQPLPCFGCGWDCAFGDAPCIKGIAVAHVLPALDAALAQRDRDFAEIRTVEHLSAETRTLMGAAAARYRSFQAAHLTRQLKLEEKDRAIAEKEAEIDQKEAAIAEKEAEIDALKVVCDERERVIKTLDGHVRHFQTESGVWQSKHALLEQTLAQLPRELQDAARAYNDQLVHVRNLEASLILKNRELDELRATAANYVAGHQSLELAKHYNKLLTEKENVIQSLRRGTAEREKVIKELAANSTGLTAALRKLWIATSAHVREKWWRPFDDWLFRRVVEDYWMQIGILRHYEPKALAWDPLPAAQLPAARLPQIGLVTPSYGQEKFIERTMLSVLQQDYPKLRYVVQDGGSKDRSAEIIARHAARLHHWESVRDNGQADAIRRGFARLESALGPDDLMAWLNSDDLLAPGALRFVAEYFVKNPGVDVIYGHRIIIDDDDRDVGRWIMPRHDRETLEWIDYVPQETMFWRKRAWDLAGGIDPSFQFALDWDLLARFQQAGCRMVRVPWFLGAFRVHAEQKTSQAIHTVGAEEMRRIRTRFHGEKQDDFETINRHARAARFRGAMTARLHAVGIRW